MKSTDFIASVASDLARPFEQTHTVLWNTIKTERWLYGLLSCLFLVAPIYTLGFQIGRGRYRNEPFAINIASLILVALVLSLLIFLISHRTFAQEFIDTVRLIIDRLDGKWVFGWLCWMFATLLWSAESENTFAGWLFTLAALLVALLIAHLVRKHWQGYLVASIGVSALLQSLIAIAQYVKHGTLGLSWLHERNDFLIMGEARSSGLMGHPNPLAFFLLMSFFIMAAYTAATRRWIMLLALVPLLLALLYTGSRGNFVSLISGLVVCGLYFLYHLDWQRRLLLSCAALLIMLAGIQLLPVQRLKALQAADIDTRLTWGYPYTLVLIQDEPMLGVGVDTAITEIHRMSGNPLMQLAHNVVLIIWAEQGIIGVIFYLMVCLSFLNRLHPRAAPAPFILTAGFLAMMIAMLVDIYFTFPYLRVLIFGYWGYLWGELLLARNQPCDTDPLAVISGSKHKYL